MKIQARKYSCIYVSVAIVLVKLANELLSLKASNTQL